MNKLLFALLFIAGTAWGQITQAPALLAQRGTTLPANCQVGQLFFKTDSAAGQNVYGCTSANTWTLQSGGGGSVDVSGTPTAGQIAVWTDADTIEGDSTPNIGAATGTSLALTGNITANNLTPSGTLTTGRLCLYSGTDIDCDTAAPSGTITGTIASGDIALATAEIASGACTSAQTDTATGTATTDTITWVFAADPTATTGYSASANGMLTIIVYPTSNTVNFKVCNNTSAAITPGAVTLNWRVVR